EMVVPVGVWNFCLIFCICWWHLVGCLYCLVGIGFGAEPQSSERWNGRPGYSPVGTGLDIRFTVLWVLDWTAVLQSSGDRVGYPVHSLAGVGMGARITVLWTLEWMSGL